MKYSGINVKGAGFSVKKAKMQTNTFAKKATKRIRDWTKKTGAF